MSGKTKGKKKFQTDSSYQGTKGSKHGYSHAECESAIHYINARLGKDKDLAHLLPLKNEKDFFEKVKDGLIMCKLINSAVKKTIDLRVMNKGTKLNTFQQMENQNLAIMSAKAIGCSLTNIGADDISKGTPHLLLGMTWQIIKIGLIQHITLKEHPELVRLLKEGETLADLLALPPEKLLLRWVNYQLKEAGSKKRVRNFGKDINDSEAYTILLNQITNGKCSKNPLKETNKKKRAELMLQQADKIDCREFISPNDVIEGNKKLNFCFVANLFNQYPAMAEVDKEEEIFEEVMEEVKDDAEIDREERVFKHWIESLGFEVTDLCSALADGLILLRLIDIIRPKTVKWKSGVIKNPSRKKIMQLVGNCSYALKLIQKHDLGKIINVGGIDIAKKNKKLTLAVIWQLMKAHSLKLIQDCGDIKGKKVTDKDLVSWANKKNTKPFRVKNFQDRRLRSGEYLCYLIKSISSQSVDDSYISTAKKKSAKLDNARYAVGCLRKIGGCVFCTAEDLAEGKKKMLMTFFASAMYVDLKKKK